MLDIKTLKIIYILLIVPITIFLIYSMFLGFGRSQMDFNIVRLKPLMSTLNFVNRSVFTKDVIVNVLGNILVFVPYGFLGLIFPKLNHYKSLFFAFTFVIIIVESLQYFTRLGVFDVDDILLNNLGVGMGFLLYQKVVLRYFTKI